MKRTNLIILGLVVAMFAYITLREAQIARLKRV